MCSNRRIWSSPCATSVCFCFISYVRLSSVRLSSSISFSMRSFLRSSRSPSAFFADMPSLSWWISFSRSSLSASAERMRSFCSITSFRSSTIWFTCWSRSLMSSSFCFSKSFTVCSWPRLRPAPCSTRRLRLAISSFSCWMVSLARASFSWLVSTIFQAFSISFFRAVMVDWSSSLSFSAVCTFAAFAMISELSSLHFLISRFSLSWDFFKARWIFSYSTRNRSRLLSPTNSESTSWMSRSRASKAFAPKASDSNPSTFFSSSAMAGASEGCAQPPRGVLGGKFGNELRNCTITKAHRERRTLSYLFSTRYPTL
mmetsp:Transcript_45548/g.75933  ORF Transcript_45548/g.75933 Transcript_45548/m.75933 type:complete len:314 (-) Transcript_45548:4-945(-)